MANKGRGITRRFFLQALGLPITLPHALMTQVPQAVSVVATQFSPITREHSAFTSWVTGGNSYGYFQQDKDQKTYGIPSLEEILRPVTQGLKPEILSDPYSIPDYVYLQEISTENVPDIYIGQIFAEDTSKLFREKEEIGYYDAYEEVTDENLAGIDEYVQSKIKLWRSCIEGFVEQNPKFTTEEIFNMKLKDFFDHVIKPYTKVALEESLKKVLDFPDLNKVSSRWSRNQMTEERLKSIVPDMAEQIDEIYRVFDLPHNTLESRRIKKEIKNGNFVVSFKGKKNGTYLYELLNKSNKGMRPEGVKRWLGENIPFVSETKVVANSNYLEQQDNREKFSIETNSYVLDRILDSMAKKRRYFDETPLERPLKAIKP